MNSFFVRNRLSDYLENDLDETARKEIEQALTEDEELQEDFENLQLTQKLLQQYGMEEPS